MTTQKHNQHLYSENERLQKRMKYRKDEKDAEASAQLHDKLRGKSVQEKDFITREFLMDHVTKQRQDKLDIDLQQKEKSCTSTK